MDLPPSLLVGLVVAIGLVPALIAQPLIEVVAGAVVGGPLPALHLKLWHGVTPALGMSIIATAGGAFLLWRHDAFNRIRLALPRPEAKTMFDATVGGLAAAEIGRAHVCTPVTNAHLVCRLLLDKKNANKYIRLRKTH